MDNRLKNFLKPRTWINIDRACFFEHDGKGRNFFLEYLPDAVFFVADIVMRDGALLAEFKIDDSAAIDPDTSERLTAAIPGLIYRGRVNPHITEKDS